MSAVLLEREDGLSIVTLNRPQSYNAMNEVMLSQLLETVKQLEGNDDRIVIICGAGDAFSAGGDVQMMADERTNEEMAETMDLINELVLRLYKLNKIVISAIHGSAAGLGLSLALNSDITLAHKDAKIGMLFAGVGFVPDGGGHFFLEKRIGAHRAKQFIWSIQQIDGKHGQAFGLIDEITEADVVETAKQYGKKLLQLPFEASIATKHIYNEQDEQKLRAILAAEKVAQIELSQTADHKEGVQAFLEKRIPRFE